MANRIVVDPITRIEGHLRIEAEIENGKIVNAYSSSTMVRGMEKIFWVRKSCDVFLVRETCQYMGGEVGSFTRPLGVIRCPPSMGIMDYHKPKQ